MAQSLNELSCLDWNYFSIFAKISIALKMFELNKGTIKMRGYALNSTKVVEESVSSMFKHLEYEISGIALVLRGL